MNKNQTIFAIIASTLSLILIVGVAIIVYFGTNSNSADDFPELIISDTTPGHYSVERTDVVKGKIEYKNAGSSSCPPVINKAKYDEKYNTYYLYVQDYENTMCTADLQGFKQIIEHEDGTDIVFPSYIEVVYPS